MYQQLLNKKGPFLLVTFCPQKQAMDLVHRKCFGGRKIEWEQWMDDWFPWFLCNISMHTGKPSSPLRNKGLSQSSQLHLGARPASAAECHPQPLEHPSCLRSQTSKQTHDWTPTNWGRSQQAHILDPWVPNTPKPISSWWLTFPSSSPSLSLEENGQHSDHKVKPTHLPLKQRAWKPICWLNSGQHTTSQNSLFFLFACLLKTESQSPDQRHSVLNEYPNKSLPRVLTSLEGPYSSPSS